MNPVELTIINPRKEYWPSWGSNQRPPVLKSATLLLNYGARHNPGDPIEKVVFEKHKAPEWQPFINAWEKNPLKKVVNMGENAGNKHLLLCLEYFLHYERQLLRF